MAVASLLGTQAGAAEPAPGTCAVANTAPEAVVRALYPLVRSVVTGTELGAAPSAVLSVRGPSWQYVQGLGWSDLSGRRPVDCAMPFQIGSNTKMMTAAVVLQLQEEGRLSLDDRLSTHLPDIAMRLPHADRMSLRQLLQHTAGVFSYTDSAPDGVQGIAVAGMADPAALRRALSPQEMIDFTVAHGRPLFEPGAPGRWAYSNTGYVLLGMVIEKIDGVPLGKSFENRIFTPLAMRSSYLWDGVPRPAFGLPRSWLKPPYDYETTQWNMSQSWAGGGVVSTLDDMHRFLEGLLGGRLFRARDTLRQMQVTVPSPIPGTTGYGLGLIHLQGSFWGHGGQTLGTISAVGVSVQHGVSFVMWGNSAQNPVVLMPADVIRALETTAAIPRSP